MIARSPLLHVVHRPHRHPLVEPARRECVIQLIHGGLRPASSVVGRHVLRVGRDVGGRRFRAARRTIQGYEAMHMIWNGQARWVSGSDVRRATFAKEAWPTTVRRRLRARVWPRMRCSTGSYLWASCFLELVQSPESRVHRRRDGYHRLGVRVHQRRAAAVGGHAGTCPAARRHVSSTGWLVDARLPSAFETRA